jgi:YesN/AraC family two-component response regulator
MRSKILLIDDNKDLCADFKLWFEDYDITAVHSAEEALAVLGKPNELGLVILDVQLPGMGGLAALEKIKAMEPGRRVIMLTGYSTKDVAIKALKGGASGYIEKPFSLKEMRAAIEKELAASPGENPADWDIDARMEHVKKFVEANCFKKVSLRDAAAAVFLSPKYLSRVFRERTGLGFTEYKLSVKISQARALFKSGPRNIKQVSAQLGYANPESFIRQFKKIAGCVPSTFRSNGACPVEHPKKRR